MTEKATTVYAPAKINLALAICSKRADGYHNLQTLFQSISLADCLEVRLKEREISCHCGILSGEDNLAYKAAKAFLDVLRIRNRSESLLGVEINIEKNIPLEAGLAGGSSDAAAVLRAMNELYAYPFSYEELLDIARQCGSDTAFCLKGGTQWGEGKGTDLSELTAAPVMDIILVKPSVGVSTAQAYHLFDQYGKYEILNKDLWINLLNSKDLKGIAGNLTNSLEEAATSLLPEIVHIKELLLEGGCYGALMSGSGSAVFGILQDIKQGETIAQRLRDSGYKDNWLLQTINSSSIWNIKE